MEKLPKLTICRDGLRVQGFLSRKKLHEPSCPWYHPTALVLVIKPDGNAFLVDKYRKDYYKALWAGHPLKGHYRKLDAFGGHIKKELLQKRDRPFLSYETFLEAAIEELQEECRIADGSGSPIPVNPSCLFYLGLSVWHEEGNRECSAFFLYHMPEDLPLAGCDDGFDQNGNLQTIILDTVEIPYPEMLQTYLQTAPDPRQDPYDGYADGLVRLIRLTETESPVPAVSKDASTKYLLDLAKTAIPSIAASRPY